MGVGGGGGATVVGGGWEGGAGDVEVVEGAEETVEEGGGGGVRGTAVTSPGGVADGTVVGEAVLRVGERVVETVVEGGRAGGGDQVDAVLGADAAVDLTVVEVEVAALVEGLLLVKGLVVPVAEVGAVVVGGAVVVLLGRVTYAKGVGVGGRDTPVICLVNVKLEAYCTSLQRYTHSPLCRRISG